MARREPHPAAASQISRASATLSASGGLSAISPGDGRTTAEWPTKTASAALHLWDQGANSCDTPLPDRLVCFSTSPSPRGSHLWISTGERARERPAGYLGRSAVPARTGARDGLRVFPGTTVSERSRSAPSNVRDQLQAQGREEEILEVTEEEG